MEQYKKGRKDGIDHQPRLWNVLKGQAHTAICVRSAHGMRHSELRALQNAHNTTILVVLQEELKTMPFGDVWNEYLSRQGVQADYLTAVEEYEKTVLAKR